MRLKSKMAAIEANTLYFVDTFDELAIIKLSRRATLPVKGGKHGDGYQLFSAFNYTIPAGAADIIATDLAVSIFLINIYSFKYIYFFR